LSGTTVIEDKGRAVIPAEARRRLGIGPGTELDADVKDGRVLLRPRRRVSAKDLLGAAGADRVDLEEIEGSQARE
jgi:AbrB family looped-hinge helix DNA binding protein